MPLRGRELDRSLPYESLVWLTCGLAYRLRAVGSKGSGAPNPVTVHSLCAPSRRGKHQQNQASPPESPLSLESPLAPRGDFGFEVQSRTRKPS